MKHTTQQSLILSLIKDDLTSSKLLDGLSALGLDSDAYIPAIMDTVTTLMGLEKPITEYEGLFER